MEDFALAYIDDICLQSDLQRPCDQVRRGLGHLQDAAQMIEAGNSKVVMAEVPYMGRKVGSGRLKPELAKVEVRRDW